MSFSHNKQNGFVTPAFWIAVAIGFLSVTALKNNESSVVEDSETYKQADLKDTVQKAVTSSSITDEE